MDLRQLESALQVFAVLGHAALPLHHVQLFVLVARAHPDPVTYPELGQALGLASSSISRSVSALSELNRHGDDGYGLLVSERDPNYGRRFIARLSHRGRTIARQLELI